MAENARQIRVAQFGHVYVAPVGTATPTNTTSTPAAAWLNLGLLSDKGVEFDFTPKFNDVSSWQSPMAAREYLQSLDIKLIMELLQTNASTLPFFFNNAAPIPNPSQAGEYQIQAQATTAVDERAMLIDWYDGVNNNRIIIPRGIATDRAKTSFARTGAVSWGTTFEVLLVDLNTPPFTWLTNDPNFNVA